MTRRKTAFFLLIVTVVLSLLSGVKAAVDEESTPTTSDNPSRAKNTVTPTASQLPEKINSSQAGRNKINFFMSIII